MARTDPGFGKPNAKDLLKYELIYCVKDGCRVDSFTRGSGKSEGLCPACKTEGKGLNVTG